MTAKKMDYSVLLDSIKSAMLTAKKWNKPFKFLDGLGYNAVTGAKLQGISQLIASAHKQSEGYSNNLWLTYAQTMQLCGFEWQENRYIYQGKGPAPQPLKGQKSVKLLYAKPPFYPFDGVLLKESQLTAEQKAEVLSGEVEPVWTWGILSYFNIDQIQCEFDRTKVKWPQQRITLHEHQTITEIDDWICDVGVSFEFNSETNPCYIPRSDKISMLPISHFKSAEDYYSTFLHEIGHATLHPSRLNRSHDYAQEELVAELVSAFKCADFGLKGDLQHAEYLVYWAGLIHDNPDAFNHAVVHALKAVKFLDKQVEQTRKNRSVGQKQIAEIRKKLSIAS